MINGNGSSLDDNQHILGIGEKEEEIQKRWGEGRRRRIGLEGRFSATGLVEGYIMMLIIEIVDLERDPGDVLALIRIHTRLATRRMKRKRTWWRARWR